jgi:hypothetical protein
MHFSRQRCLLREQLEQWIRIQQGADGSKSVGKNANAPRWLSAQPRRWKGCCSSEQGLVGQFFMVARHCNWLQEALVVTNLHYNGKLEIVIHLFDSNFRSQYYLIGTAVACSLSERSSSGVRVRSSFTVVGLWSTRDTDGVAPMSDSPSASSLDVSRFPPKSMTSR